MFKTVAQILYVLVGLAFVAAGAAVLLLGTNLLPDTIRNAVIHEGRNDALTLHIMQEFGCLLVFAGLMCVWFASHYDQSRAFHWAMTLFWTLFALIHWFDIHGVLHTGRSQALVTIPAVVFFVVGLLRNR